MPASVSQQGGDPAPNGDCKQSPTDQWIAVSAILPGQLDHIGHQQAFIGTASRRFALSGSMLSENPACPTLRDVQFSTNAINTGTTTSGAQKFPFAASAKMNLSSVRSDTAFLNRSFSF